MNKHLQRVITEMVADLIRQKNNLKDFPDEVMAAEYSIGTALDIAEAMELDRRQIHRDALEEVRG
ncbi:hypothetical protein GTO91_03135 [Heliobacterium undosum]|uniref:Uncharacterized protein n=1 Tax=Heliomicrobium undosum TaxID=121734 RepID=A0A845KY59_9FIRM|nr:hypothetical protein [Heliomicrobium undosum]MZP28712.1 hypothetical protein [Heliomicrobium undosum]MZP28713.1 hypothetical protein [Heliomicrobium undosum]